jgi:hypothetical protein
MQLRVCADEEYPAVWVFADLPITVTAPKMASVAQAVTRVNYLTGIATMRLTPDGRLRACCTIEGLEGSLGELTVTRACRATMELAERHGPAFMALALGHATLNKAFPFVAAD